jgi:N-acetyl-alpha-D-muramate 1-phosphate uridylyltransferase
VGYLGERIEEAVGNGRDLGLEILYSYDEAPGAGTAAAVLRALPLLGDEFLVLYGDTYLRIDYADVARTFRSSGLPALMTVLRNSGRWGTSNAVYENGLVLRYDKRASEAGMQWIDYGLGALSPRALEIGAPGVLDLADVYRELAEQRLLAGYVATERFYEIGTPEALRETEAFLTDSAPPRALK